MSLRKTLPPMNSLTAFEAAARHQNFRRASDELHVTREAISRQIRLLEKFVGSDLFVRNHTGVKLTPTGIKLFASIAPCLKDMSAIFSDITSPESTSESHLKITTTIKFATLWLSRRIIDFNEKYPHINVGVMVSDQILDLNSSDIDIAIRYGNGSWEDVDVIGSLIESVHYFPICSPSYLAKLPNSPTVDDIARSRLLYLTGSSHEWENWDTWFKAICGNVVQSSNNSSFDNYTSILQSAIDGHGIALGWDVVVDDLLKEGVIVCPVKETVKTGHGYYLVKQPTKALNSPMQLFVDWLCEEVHLTRNNALPQA